MAEEKTVARKNVWLIKHPVSEYYKETQKEIKRLGLIADVKIFDAKLKDRIDSALVVEHGLTLINDEPVEDDDEAEKKAAKAQKAADRKAAKAEKEAEENSSE